MSETYGPQAPTREDVDRATRHTAAVNADPSASLMAGLRAAEAEAAALIAYRHAGRDPDVIPISSRARQGQLESTHEELEAGG
jgi:hypothetical protein